MLRTQMPAHTCVSSSFTTAPICNQYNFRYHTQIVGGIFLVCLIRFPTGQIRLTIRTQKSKAAAQSDIRHI